MPYKDEDKRREHDREKAERIRRERGIPIRTKQSKEERKASQKISNKKYRQVHKAEIARRANVWYHKNKERLNQGKREWRKGNRGKVRVGEDLLNYFSSITAPHTVLVLWSAYIRAVYLGYL